MFRAMKMGSYDAIFLQTLTFHITRIFIKIYYIQNVLNIYRLL